MRYHAAVDRSMDAFARASCALPRAIPPTADPQNPVSDAFSPPTLLRPRSEDAVVQAKIAPGLLRPRTTSLNPSNSAVPHSIDVYTECSSTSAGPVSPPASLAHRHRAPPRARACASSPLSRPQRARRLGVAARRFQTGGSFARTHDAPSSTESAMNARCPSDAEARTAAAKGWCPSAFAEASGLRQSEGRASGCQPPLEDPGRGIATAAPNDAPSSVDTSVLAPTGSRDDASARARRSRAVARRLPLGSPPDAATTACPSRWVANKHLAPGLDRRRSTGARPADPPTRRAPCLWIRPRPALAATG